MNILFERIKELFWKNNILSNKQKEIIFYYLKSKVRGKITKHELLDKELNLYIKQILTIQNYKNDKYVDLAKDCYIREKNDAKILAYYLPQYYPTEYNDKWWGKGSTEWTNVSKSVPQYIGHYQPRLPGELGYYDLRIDENIERQVELAKIYGIYGFCYYYYWFDGKRLLDVPLDKFLNNRNLKFPYCICWVNESWSRQWFGNSNECLIEQRKNVDSYRNFIKDSVKYLKNDNYITINGKKVLIVYKIYDIPDIENTINYWREYVYKNYGYELYLIGIMYRDYKKYKKDNFINKGFDALSEFSIPSHLDLFKDIRSEKTFVCNEFLGNIFSYPEFVKNKKFFSERIDKLYRAVTPMWDNTARKVNKGHILDGSTPELYQEWLENIIKENKQRTDLDDNIVFINAWNEWAEGAYLEPDRYWGYAYLQATRNAIENNRNKE